MAVKFKTVYRVEHYESGEGPYQLNSRILERLCFAHTKNSLRPCASRDFSYHILKKYIENSSSGYVFGFKSLESLEQWFEGWLDPLKKEGYVVKEYKTTRIIESDSKLQIIFKKNFSTKIIE